MNPFLNYLQELKQIPVFKWSFLGLSQTIEQDDKTLLPSLYKYLPMSFEGSIDLALWKTLNHQDFSESNSWAVQKKRILLSIQLNEPVTVPAKFEKRKTTLLTFKAGLIAEQKRIQEILYTFDPITDEDTDEIPF